MDEINTSQTNTQEETIKILETYIPGFKFDLTNKSYEDSLNEMYETIGKIEEVLDKYPTIEKEKRDLIVGAIRNLYLKHANTKVGPEPGAALAEMGKYIEKKFSGEEPKGRV